MPKRFAKQLVYAVIYFVLWGGIAYGVLLALRPSIAVPTCFDGVRNQNEEDIDCGGSCDRECLLRPEYPVVRSVKYFRSDDSFWDSMVSLENLNIKQGAARVPYVLTASDSSGNIVLRREGETYVLPTQRRWVVEQALDTGGAAIANAVWTIVEDKIEWQELMEYQEAGLVIEEQTLRILALTTVYAEATGIVVNRSPFDYDTLEVVVMVMDAAGTTLAVRETEMRTLRSGERRAFRVAWRRPFPREGTRVTMEAYTNLLLDENYMGRYGRPERFQQLQ